MENIKKTAICTIFLLILVLNSPTILAFPTTKSLNIQTRNETNDIINGTFDFNFSISSNADCSSPDYTDNQTLTTTSDGIVNVLLEDVDVDFSTADYRLCYWLDNELKMNKSFSSVPYTDVAERWDGLNTTNATQMEDNGGVLNIKESWLTTFINSFGFLTGNIFDQSLNTTDNVKFNHLNLTGNVTLDDGAVFDFPKEGGYSIVWFDNSLTNGGLIFMLDGIFVADTGQFDNLTIIDLLTTNSIVSSDWSNFTGTSNQITDFNSTVQDLSLNQTEADSLYAGAEWGYNQTTPANDYTDTQIASVNTTANIEALGFSTSGGDNFYPTYINLTASTYNGSLVSGGKTGYAAAHDICNTEFTGSHMCNEFEVDMWYKGSGNQNDIASGSAWVSAGGPKYVPADIPVNDCNGWTHGVAGTYLGNYYSFNNNTGGDPRAFNCGATYNLACCTYE